MSQKTSNTGQDTHVQVTIRRPSTNRRLSKTIIRFIIATLDWQTAKAGKEDGFWLHGGTAIVAPTGEIVAKSNTEEDEVVSYDCDMELGEYIRNTTFNFAKHRRPEHYKLIVERTGVKVEPSN